MKINMIAAMCNNRGIGISNKIPWNIKSDMKYFFKQTTSCGKKRENNRYKNAVFLGTNTLLSLPKPLKYRDSFIITRKVNKVQEQDGYTFVNNVFDCINICEKLNYEQLWCIGGSQIYQHVLDEIVLDEIHLTKIYHHYDCDTFFPELPDFYKKYKERKQIEDDILLSYTVYKPDIRTEHIA